VDWTKYGAAVISKVRNKNPSAYLRILASIVPRDLPSPTWNNEFKDLTDEELRADLIRTARLLLGEEQVVAQKVDAPRSVNWRSDEK
jgi:hypothetical protein